MKIIFLDVDGVLNSDRYMASQKFNEEIRGYKDMWEVINKVPHTHLDPAAIKLLNTLVEQSGAEVVLSSTWRLRFTLDEMNEMLASRGAKFTIVNKTPPARRFRSYRGEEVRDYLKSLEEQPESFVILDDIDQFPLLKDNFVRTTERDGLTETHVQKALDILNKKD